MMRSLNYLSEVLMTFQDFIKQFNDFLFAQSGITNTLFDHVRLGRSEPVKSLFFNPCQSKKEFFYKGASVITAPVCLSLLSLELATASLYLGIKSAVNLAKSNTHGAKIYIQDAVAHLICAFVAAIVALASPIINLVDFAGAGINTLRQKNEIPQAMQPSI